MSQCLCASSPWSAFWLWRHLTINYLKNTASIQSSSTVPYTRLRKFAVPYSHFFGVPKELLVSIPRSCTPPSHPHLSLTFYSGPVLLTMAPGTASASNVESKSAKKKRGKSEARPTSSTGTATPAADATSQALPADLAANGVDGAHDSPYLKELNK